MLGGVLWAVSAPAEASELRESEGREAKAPRWRLKDAIGNPFPAVSVKHETFLKSGRWYVISHQDYGIARMNQHMYSQAEVFVPLVRRGTRAAERGIRGFIVDPEYNPVPGATVKCTTVRTLGEGLVSALNGWEYVVVSDDEGRFSMYLPNEKRRDDRGDLIPPKSTYHVLIEAPNDLGLPPYVGAIRNGQEVTITMDRGEFFQAFVFEDESGPITDANQLKTINIVVKRPGKGLLRLAYDDWKNAGWFPEGTYHATIKRGPRKYEFEPVRVSADSPEELVFRFSDEVEYWGRVLHGITGAPMEGAFVIAMHVSSKGNFSQITAEQWEALHELPPDPCVGEAALAPVRQLYGFSEIVRTDGNGWFHLRIGRGQRFYGFVLFEQDYLGVLYRRFDLKADQNGVVEVPAIRLFPAAKVVVAPRVEEERVSISPNWVVDKDYNPQWADTLLAIDNGRQSSLTYSRKWLKQNEAQTIHVPAGLNVQVQLRIPYDTQWCPFTIAETVHLGQGQIHDLGRQMLQPALKVSVRVINSAGQLVEGVPVRKASGGNNWSVPHNTDERGMARFNIPPYSKGEFGVRCGNGDSLSKEIIPYEVGAEDDADVEFELMLSDEMLQALFK